MASTATPTALGRMVLVALVLGLVGLTARPALAGDDHAGSPQARRRAAGQHVQKGDRYKDAGNFRAAEREYQKAYDLVPHPLLLFDLAQVHRLDGDADVALDYYRRYLAASPKGPAAAQARHYAAVLESKLARQGHRIGSGHDHDHGGAEVRTGHGGDTDQAGHGGDTDQAGHGGDTDQAGHGGDTGQAGGDHQGDLTGTGAGAGGQVDLHAGATSRRNRRWLRIGGMVAAGAGALSIAVGIKYGFDARAISDRLSNHTGAWTDKLLAEQSRGKSFNRKMIIFSAAGGVAIAAGAVLYYLGHRPGADQEISGRGAAGDGDQVESAVSVAPLVSPGAVGLVLDGRFR